MPDTTEENLIQGFSKELNHEELSRIDRLVDNYESSILARLDGEHEKSTKWSEHLADSFASFGGSWKFIIIFAVFLLAWLVWNTLPVIFPHFDPNPFGLLNLSLSFIAAFQAPVIMMSQNRQAAREKQESIIDFSINFKAEQEIDDMQGHLHRIEGEIKEIKQLLLEIRSESLPKDDMRSYESPVK